MLRTDPGFTIFPYTPAHRLCFPRRETIQYRTVLIQDMYIVFHRVFCNHPLFPTAGQQELPSMGFFIISIGIPALADGYITFHILRNLRRITNRSSNRTNIVAQLKRKNAAHYFSFHICPASPFSCRCLQSHHPMKADSASLKSRQHPTGGSVLQSKSFLCLFQYIKSHSLLLKNLPCSHRRMFF